jgi:hypothetical protein
LVSLLEHKFSRNAPANAYGQKPFVVGHDFSNPNEDYFAHADWVLRQAAQNGLLVLLTPSYLGADGGDQGWYQEMIANGTTKLRQYGQYLGARYRDFANIVWVHGGDYNPPKKDLVNAIAEGIRAVDKRVLHTAHWDPETAAIEHWQGEPKLNLNSVYTYAPVYVAALRQYSRPEQMPFFLIESVYEHEHRATEQRLRAQAYQALLSGASGQIFGNNPIWHFDGPGLLPAPVSWQQALGGRGTQSMTHLHNLFSRVAWWLLMPDLDNSFVSGEIGSGQHRSVAARANDRSFGILYLPSARAVTVNLALLAGPYVSAHWYDPANGKFSVATGSPFRADGLQKFRAMPRNSFGFGDWVLVLESHS